MENRKLGLIAGNGRFPLLLAREAKKRGNYLVVVAFPEETDPKINDWADELFWIPLGALSRLIGTFQQAGVREAVMAGQIKHRRIFLPLLFDSRVRRLLREVKTKQAGSILGAVVKELEEAGIKLLSSLTYLEENVAGEGVLASGKLTEGEKADLEFGYSLTLTVAQLDIGQTVVVKNKTVVAVEAMEGTDECIRRAASIAGAGIVVVKVARPRQDLRFDVPVIGLQTLKVLQECRVSLLGIEAKKTLILDKDELLAKAGKLKIKIFGLSPDISENR